MKFKLLFLATLFAFTSCQKEEGEGGKASISGKVYVHDYDGSFTQLQAEYYAAEQDVYIVYGDHDVYDDDMKTSYNGAFEFKYLRKGTYSIFVYSKDSTQQSQSGIVPVITKVVIDQKDEEVLLSDIVIFN